MKSKFIRALIVCLIVCVIGAGGYYGYKKYFGTKAATTTQSYMTVAAKKMNLSVGVQGTGSVYAAVSKDIVSNNSGTVSGLSVNIGDTVKQGQQLFTVNNAQLSQSLTKAEDTLEKQKLALASAKTSNEVTSDNLSINDAQADVNYDIAQVNGMKVTSPINGIVTAENNANGDNVQSGKAILTVVDPSSMNVNVAVDELDIEKVKVGQKADITFDAISGKTYSGTVKAISPTGTTSNDVTTYNVTVSVDNPTDVKLGMNANVNIDVASKEDALTIPAEALIERNGKDYVMVADSTSTTGSGNTGSTSGGNQSTGTNQQSSGAASKSGQSGQYSGNSSMRSRYSGQGKLVEIKIGLENENYIEVTEGLTEGEKVLVQLPQVNSTTTNSRSGLGGLGGGMGGSFGGYGGGTGGNRNQSSNSSGKSN
jgi:HlyD family secretion protein